MLRKMAQRLGKVAIAGLLCLTAGCAQAHPGRPLIAGSVSSLPRSRSSHIVVIMLENAEYGEVIGGGAPYVDSLARRYALATQSYAITHPSLPNYLALTSGSTDGISSDCTSCHTGARNIVDQLEAHRISWKAYLESVPSACYHGAETGEYAKRHNPFIYYDDVAKSSRRCHRLVGFGALRQDLRAGRLPTFAWITPNVCNDGHNCGVAGANRFLQENVPTILRELGPHGFLILTWDEGSSEKGCCGGQASGGRIATVLAGPEVRGGARLNTPIDHYGVLGTIESALGLPPLGGARNPRSGRLTALFEHPPHIR